MDQAEKSKMNNMPSTRKQAMKKMIGGLESNGNYNIMVGGKEVPLTNMTIGQVLDMQSKMDGDTAAGKYQIKESTLRSLVYKPGKKEGTYSKELRNPDDFSPDTPFDELAQEWAADAILDRRGWSDFEAGKITDKQMATNLAKEWASLPDPAKGTNASHYGGDGKHDNATRASTDDVFKILNVVETQGGMNGRSQPIAPPMAGEGAQRPSPLQGNSGGAPMRQDPLRGGHPHPSSLRR
jgi:muramidase (phage lysozyme)